MSLFNINGKEISASGTATVSEALVRQAIINGVTSGEIELPTTTTSGTLSIDSGVSNYTDWMDGVQTAYESMIADYRKDDVDGIPLFIGTDFHGSGLAALRIPHNTDKDVMCLGLGDFIKNYFNTTELASIKTTTKPIDNIICVPGNHDVCTDASASDARPSYYTLRDAFHVTDPLCPDNKLYFAHIDEKHNVKYLALSNYNLNAEGYGMHTSYSDAIHTAQMDWLIRELGKDDGLDIIILSHEPMTNTLLLRDGTTEEWQTSENFFAAVMTVLTARKNKTSGTVTDSDGVEHSFDFSYCKSDLLCSFHGHLHTELYSTEGITQYVERNYSTNVAGCVSWALIDRNAKTLTIYKAGFDNLVIPL